MSSEAEEPPQSAGALATRRVPTADPGQTAGEVRTSLAGAAIDSAAEVAVVERGALVGVVPIEAVLAAAPQTPVADLIDRDPPSIAPEQSDEAAAAAMAGGDGRSLAVVDAGGRFLGLIPPARMLSVLEREHEEDLARIGGYRVGAGRAQRAARESVSRRLGHRLPWLLVGLVGAMASALLIGSFEDELDRKVLLAFFVPAVVYMADAVGTQTEAILIRGLAVGVTVREVLGREILTGAVTGAICIATRCWRCWPRSWGWRSYRSCSSAGQMRTWPSRLRWRSSPAARSRPPSRWRCPGCSSAPGRIPRSGRDRSRP